MSRKEKKRPARKSNRFVTIGIAIVLILIALAVGLSRTLKWFD